MDNRTDYEPNFIIKEPDPIRGSAAADKPSSDSAAQNSNFTCGNSSTYGFNNSEDHESRSSAPYGSSTSAAYGSGSSADASDNAAGATRPENNRFEQNRSENSRFEQSRPEYNHSDHNQSEHTTSAAWINGEHVGRGFSYKGNYNGSGYGSSSSLSGQSGQSGQNRQAGQSGQTGRKQKRTKKARKPSPPVTLTRKSLGLIVAGCMAASCIFGLGGAYIGNNLWQSGTSGTASTSADNSGDKDYKTTGYNLENATGSNMTVQEITESTQKSVVEIKTESASGDSWLSNYVTEGAGSGVIISKDGYIMTNNHVIDGANKITVTTSDEKSYDADLIGTDSTNDVAVIKIKASGLTPVTYGNSDQLQVGDLAVAIGNPLGELGGTVTAGIISATDRQLTIDGTTMTLLQTDSSINPGNSGGGLFNGDGQLIGLVVAKSSGSDVEGLGFAIPVNKAANVAQQLMDDGYVSGQPYSGMTYTEGSSGFDSFFGESSGTVYIYSVESAKAKLAGFKAGDVVYSIDGTEIASIDDVTAVLTAHNVGDTVTYTVLRDGQAKDISLKLQEKPKSVQNEQSSQQNSQEETQGNNIMDNFQ